MHASETRGPGQAILQPIGRRVSSVASSASLSIVAHAVDNAVISVFHTLTEKLWHAWLTLQVSHRGKYSIERLLALEEYSRRASWRRVLLVCVATPLPMMVLVLTQESVPLAPPADGWRCNYGFWFRVMLLAAAVANAFGITATYMIPRLKLSLGQLSVLVLTSAVAYGAAGIAVAAVWMFPIPFIGILFDIPHYLLLAAIIRLLTGPRAWHEIRTQHWPQVRRFNHIVVVAVVTSIVYPIHLKAFSITKGTPWELPVILLLPVIKLANKNVMALCIAHLEDQVPEAVLCTVELFNALYVATCMQQTSSLITVTIMIIDLGQTVFSLYLLHRRTAKMLERLRRCVNDHGLGHGNLLRALRMLCEQQLQHTTPKTPRPSAIRLRSCIRHGLSPATLELLNSLEALRVFDQKVSRSRQSSVMCTSREPIKSQGRSCGRLWLGQISSMGSKVALILPRLPSVHSPRLGISSNAVRPLSARTLAVQTNPRVDTVRETAVRRIATPETSRLVINTTPLSRSTSQRIPGTTLTNAVLDDALAVLFTSECMVLTEYVESAIPFLYGIYLLVMVRLPSARYHIELEGITRDNVGGTLHGVFFYALLEAASFVLLAVLLWRNCGLRALTQLAFVLETQVGLVQSKLIVWTLIAVGLRVVHFNNDELL